MPNNTKRMCPACGLFICNSHELPFQTNQAWRNKVVNVIGYNQEFIKSLEAKTKNYKHLFDDMDIINL